MRTPRPYHRLIALIAAASSLGVAAAQTTVTIATVNNPDMQVMQELSTRFTAENPDIVLQWLVLDEATLRSRVTTDAATGGASFDIVTIGAYDTPLWGVNGWLQSIDALAAQYPDAAEGYDFDDLLPAIRDGLSYDGELFAVPFYGESSFTMYNKRILDEAGLTMPEQPTWDEIAEIACAVHDPAAGVTGVALRGKPGWGDNMAPITTVVNTFGGQWFDAEGRPQIDSPEWNAAISFYADLVQRCGPAGVTGVSFPEALSLMSQGRAAIWVDATVAAGFLANSPGRRRHRPRPRPRRPRPQGQPVAVVVEPRDPVDQRRRRGRVPLHDVGHLEGVHRAGRRREGLGAGPARHARQHLRAAGVPGRRALRPDGARRHPGRRPARRDGEAPDRARRPVRADPRVPGHRRRRRADRGRDPGRQRRRDHRPPARPAPRRRGDAGRRLLLSPRSVGGPRLGPPTPAAGPAHPDRGGRMSRSTSAPKPRRRIGEARRFLSAPALIYLILMTQVPFALTIWFSFTNWNLLRPASAGFLGFETCSATSRASSPTPTSTSCCATPSS
jgi:hypothetical protein